MMCQLSVLVPVCNVERYLPQCLDSLCAQTLADVEFICIDDGSEDRSGEILDAYAARDARFRIVHKENSGYGASMNLGLRMARGKYIGIVESDDSAEADMFQRLCACAEREQADIVKANYFEESAQGTAFFEALKGHSYHRVLQPLRDEPSLLSAPPSIWSGIYRRAFLLEHAIDFNETRGASFQDTAFFLLTMSCAGRVVLLRDAFLHYRVDNAGSSVHSTKKIYAILAEDDKVYAYMRERLALAQQAGPWLAAAMYQKFLWNERRLSRRACCAFWERAVQHLVRYERAGWLDRTCWDEAAWQDVQDFLRCPQQTAFQHFVALQENWQIFLGLIQELRQAKLVYLYGAGQVARSVLMGLQAWQIPVAGLLVRARDGNPAEVLHVQVRQLAGTALEREAVVVIAVSPRNAMAQQEIYQALREQGVENIIILTKSLQRSLQQ